ncbi:hypothetical protein LguiB_010474 [Lonicera macranthoides]
MERYKVDTVQSFLNFHQIVDFQKRLIEPLKQLEPTIRAFYHKYLDIDENTLAWIIAIDVLFLLDLLSGYSDDFAVKVRLAESPPKKADLVVEVEMEMEKQDTILNASEIVDVVLSSGIGGEALKPLQVINNLPWEKISNLLGHKTVNKQDKINIPIVEKISVPSVTYLSNIAGVEFKPTGGVRDVEVDEKKGILYLPVITLNDNTEVMLRNLVAYEATISNSGLVLEDYMDLMGGIIDTADDVTMLITKEGVYLACHGVSTCRLVHALSIRVILTHS